ncbi:DNA replication complex GINS protein PSF3 [Tribolium castaneum]|uniref:DNA replication complex GINS protein PSF3 n=1 Tax=Tribolium castaneum TaxID=7070 RepID=D6WSJ1_TRICA|nr:PREDICTED: DNA replication complex GINS protein PSF3 [Tribolium castaneum]EFA07113.1 DNA replication complex GINS protein PSF3-like Protein [Tribolium castaneum]|eukprot:XP_968536.1 PREDICTED: DNA replication complex GINS protein PSF3 [Tribolium castaneum]
MPLQTSYFPDYFSVDDILATQEKIPCKFIQNVPKLGKLNPATEDPDLQSGTVLEMPLWLVLEASLMRQPIVTADLPKVYKDAYLEILKADPCAVDLHKFGVYFYELGSYMKQFGQNDDIAKTLLHTFTLRFRQIMDLSDNVISDPNVIQKLDALEKSLYESGHDAKMKLFSWLKMSEIPLEAATMVTNHKKRKRVDEDLF